MVLIKAISSLNKIKNSNSFLLLCDIFSFEHVLHTVLKSSTVERKANIGPSLDIGHLATLQRLSDFWDLVKNIETAHSKLVQ